MNETTQFLANHTTPVLFLAIFIEQIGLPIPAAPLLVAAGALVADGALNPALAIFVTLAACVLPDLLWFHIGRRGGKGLFRFLCRLPLCDASSFERTERLFAKYGMSAVVGAKFIPGLSVLIPPLAGALKIDLQKFLKFDALGSLIYGIFYLELGFLFSTEVNDLLDLFGQFSAVTLLLAVSLVLIFITCKYVQHRKSTLPASAPAPKALATT